MSELAPLLDTSVMTVSGKTLGENLEGVTVRNREIIRPLDEPLQADGGLRIVRGNLAPDGAVVKTAATSPALLRHTGPAAILPRRSHKRGQERDMGDFQAQVDRALAHVTADHVLVSRNLGPVGAPGMVGGGNMGLPTHLLQQGVRVVDHRMSGTVVLHVAPEAAVGGPLAAVEDGDVIELDVEASTLNLRVEEREIQRRLAAWTPPEPAYDLGYRSLWIDQVLQAPDGCDFRFNVDLEWRMTR